MKSRYKMRFGFEFECLVSREHPFDIRGYHDGVTDDDYGGFKFEEDGSIEVDRDSYRGCEVITEPYRLTQLPKVLSRFKDLSSHADIRVNETCGLHISFSCDGLNLSRVFPYTVIKDLRQKVLKKYPEMAHGYNRSYAQEVEGYGDYRQNRRAEFNIKNDYIEWRSIHCSFLSGSKGLDLLKEVGQLIKYVNGLIEREVSTYLEAGVIETREYSSSVKRSRNAHRQEIVPELLIVNSKTIQYV